LGITASSKQSSGLFTPAANRLGVLCLKMLMKPLTLEIVFKLLGTQNIPGSPKELEILCMRISELVELNGEDWIRENRQKLIDEWYYIIRQGIIH
jgi:hypothetical protein